LSVKHDGNADSSTLLQPTREIDPFECEKRWQRRFTYRRWVTNDYSQWNFAIVC
jgi:hypothetical protein